MDVGHLRPDFGIFSQVVAVGALTLNTDQGIMCDETRATIGAENVKIRPASHSDVKDLVELLRESRRVLAPEGMVLLTTPAAWSDRLLKAMARVRLVSKEEIDEHVYAYTLPLLGWYFGTAGFQMDRLRFGYFELGLNMWATARN